MNACEKYKAARKVTPNAPMYVDEFGPGGYYFGLNQWYEDGLERNKGARELFGLDDAAYYHLKGCTGDNIFVPPFETKILSEDDEYIIKTDHMGRVTKERKNPQFQYMPEYMGHCVNSPDDWYNVVKPRLNPNSQERYENFESKVAEAKEMQENGLVITYICDGGYMYLRDLLGPEGIMYAFYDIPEVIHDMMESWYQCHNALSEKFQNHLDIDELFFKEDICYKTSSLISRETFDEFLSPYYKRLISSIKARQKSSFFIGIDSDGHIDTVIPWYYDLGVRAFSPFEVAADCDVVELGEKYPDICISGGFDKRILATTKENIEKELMRIMPVMKARGGYIITNDHGVPEDVPLANYAYFRKRIVELSN